VLEDLSKQELDFIDRLGLIAESGGLTRVTGRIWGLLIVSDHPLAPAEIAETLAVSRASVSMSIKVLETFDLLEESTRPGDRQTYYSLREHPYLAMIETQAKKIAAQAALVQNALQEIDRPEARRRLRDLANFYEIVEEGHRTMLKEIEALKVS